MPLEPIDPTRSLIGAALPKPVEVGNQPDLLEIAGAAVRQSNTVGSLLSSEAVWTPDGPDDPDFDAWSEIKGTEYEPRFDRFVGANNRTKFEAIRRDIDRETADRETIDRGGLAGTATSIGAAIFDLPTLLPGGTLIRSGKAGYSLAKSALAVGGAAAAGAAASEGVLQATQQTRPVSESVMAIGGSALLGGVLGAAGARLLGAAEYRALSGALERDMVVPGAMEEADILGSEFQRAFSAGAAATDRPTLEALEVAPGALGLAKGVAKATANLSPLMRAVTSESPVTRRLASELYENPVYLRMNTEGMTVGSAAETARKQYIAGLGQFLEELKAGRRELAKAGQKMSEREFAERVGQAMRRGDVDINGNEAVTKVAAFARQKVIEPLTKAAIEMGLLPKDVQVSTAPSYFSRVWLRKKLNSQEVEFKRVAKDYFRKELDKLPPGKGPDDAIPGDAESYLDDIVNGVFDKLTGRAGEIADPFRITVGARGPLKERTFAIPDELVEPWLDSDARSVLTRYTRVLGADVELARRFGDPQMSGAFKEIADDYAALRKAVTNEKELRRLAKAEEADKRDIAAGRDLLRGIYLNGGRLEDSTWRQISTIAKLYQYTTKMGGAVVSSLPDAGRHVMVHGMGRVMGEGIPALIGRLKGTQSGYARAIGEAKLAGQVWDNLIQTRLATLAEISDPYSTGTPFERFVSNLGAWFSRLNLLGLWNDANKGFASVLTQNRIADNVLSGMGSIDAKERAYLAYLGIDEGMANRIARQMKEAGAEKIDGAWVANTERWTDDVARRRFYDAVNKDVDTSIITKGVGDVPLFMNTPVGSMMGQFKSFLLASNQRVLIRGLQEDQTNFLTGLVTMVTLGMASSALYSLASGREMSDNPGKWLAEGIDRSGIFSVAFELNNTAAKVGAPDIYMGLQSLFEGEQRAPASRFASRGVAGALLGPTFGTLIDAGTASRAITTGEWSQSDVNALRRLLPYQNLFYIRRALDALQDEAFGP